jgi:hypothetical protein
VQDQLDSQGSQDKWEFLEVKGPGEKLDCQEGLEAQDRLDNKAVQEHKGRQEAGVPRVPPEWKDLEDP